MFSHKINDEMELSLLELHHAGELYYLIDRNRDHLKQWLPWVGSTIHPDHTREFIRGALQQYALNQGFHCGIWYKGEFAGVIGFHPVDWVNRQVSIGYWLGKKYTGKGLMTSACRIFLDYAFDVWRLNRVEIRCATENHRSRAIPERLGFIHEGNIRETEWLYDHFTDHVVYGMLAREWQEIKRRV